MPGEDPFDVQHHDDLMRLEPRVRELVAELLDDVEDGFDAVVPASSLTARAVYELIGLPEADWPQLEEWTRALHAQLPSSLAEIPEFGAFIVAGTETTSCLMANLLYELLVDRARRDDVPLGASDGDGAPGPRQGGPRLPRAPMHGWRPVCCFGGGRE